MIEVKGLYRYPLKGFSPERLSKVAIAAGRGFPLDRRWALTNGNWTFDVNQYEPRAKTEFLALMTHPKIAALKLALSDDEQTLVLSSVDDPTLERRFVISTVAGRAGFARYVGEYLDLDNPSLPCLAQGTDNLFTDLVPVHSDLSSAVSILNLASLRALERATGRELNHLRFRANIYIDGAAAWEELSWLGRRVRIGPVDFKVVMGTRRCAVTNVDPDTGVRTGGIPQAIVKNFGHQLLGIYARACSDGDIADLDNVEVLHEGDISEPQILVYSGVEFPLYS